MEEFTRKFNVAQEKDAEIRHILTTVYAALAEVAVWEDEPAERDE